MHWPGAIIIVFSNARRQDVRFDQQQQLGVLWMRAASRARQSRELSHSCRCSHYYLGMHAASAALCDIIYYINIIYGIATACDYLLSNQKSFGAEAH